uniref:Uncharacterized protein n=1 Tax=Anopheles epiroticus TaxID=199890 RepID=A0A182P3G3_9DIPT
MGVANIGNKENWEPDGIVPPEYEDDYDDGNDQPVVDETSSTETKNVVAELCKQRHISSDLELQLQQFFKENPHIEPLPPSQPCVDINLNDPEEETWIIQCPASINVEEELINKKINLAATRSTIKNCSVPLEAQVQINRSERVVGLQSGSRVKSFVPVGLIRISEALPTVAEPVLQDVSNDSNVTVPYPEEIRERHPLLGYDFNEYLRLPKRVHKQLSFAQQKAELFYKNTPIAPKNISPIDAVPSTAGSAEPTPVVSTLSKSRKRKAGSVVEDVVGTASIKQEQLSPKRKKQNNEEEVQTVSVKQEVTMEDDISWLLNI